MQSCHFLPALRRKHFAVKLHALAYSLANFLLTLALPARVRQLSLTTLHDRLMKIGVKIVRHSRSVTFPMAEAIVSCGLFQRMLDVITALRPLPPARC